MPVRKEIFISYAHEDEQLRDKLVAHLSGLRWQELIIDWYDRKIDAGMDWAKEIDMHLNTAQMIILLVSPDFMASRYCYGVEMLRAMERHNAREACVIPVILRPVYWMEAPFSKLEVLPTDGKAVISSSWQYSDEAFVDVVQGIRKAIDNLNLYPVVRSPSIRYTVEETVDSNRLYNALVRLDYREQVKAFQQFKNEKRQCGAFLIHGAPSYGQIWLLNRLVKQLPNSSVALDFKFSFERKVCGRSFKDLWNELAKWVGLKHIPFPADFSSQQEIVHRIHGLWQRHTVILILNKLHEIIDEQYLNKFMQEFWEPLAVSARETLSQSPEHYLLMFLVDHDNCVDKWTLPIAQQLDLTWKPHVPIKLEKLTQISYDVLNDWIGYEVDTLPASLTAQEILDNSEDGIPELVLDHVCGLFDSEWPELVKYRV